MMTREELLRALRAAPGGTYIKDFHQGQWEAIAAACVRGNRVLLVEPTGWGKSLVYFGATLRLRRDGAGPTLLISPLTALMRDQRRAAESLGVTARFINSENTDEWVVIKEELRRNEVDVLFLTPEKLANEKILDEYVMPFVKDVRLFVVDEAHCISDWGHAFRPDYQRIRRMVAGRLEDGVAVLGCTATANDRVVADIEQQFGAGAKTIRGPLARKSLMLQTIDMPHRADRYAWLAEVIPTMEGSGIVYVSTKRDADRVAAWLLSNGISAAAYHSGVDGDEAGDGREQREKDLHSNDLKVLVATQALGMGFDKPDLAFVIHYQAPMSVIQYYQQAGRAGRRLDQAFAVLLHGSEDEHIIRYFIDSAFPPQAAVAQILAALGEANDGLSVPMLLSRIDVKRSVIEAALKQLDVLDRAPVYKEGSRWFRSQYDYRPDHDRMAAVTAVKEREWQRMKDYASTRECLMEFLTKELDDPAHAPCGQCSNCRGKPLLPMQASEQMVQKAVEHLRGTGRRRIEPKRMWPTGVAFKAYPWRGSISPDLQMAEGRTLSVWGDPGLADLVKAGKQRAGAFADELVEASVEVILKQWTPPPQIKWVTCVPSRRSRDLVPNFARRLAAALGLPFSAALEKVRDTAQQKDMVNSVYQARNLDGAFAVQSELVLDGPCLLVDDMVDSKWSLTICAALLRQEGVPVVYPYALADTGKN